MMDLSKPVMIAKSFWWVGTAKTTNDFQCNSYLLIKGKSAILFEPGSTLDGKSNLEKVSKLVPIDKIEAIVISHQDPDLCTAIPFFEEAGFKGVICCHERTALIVQFYNFRSERYLVNHHQNQYVLQDGSTLSFISAPYLHFPGAIMTYIPTQKILVSGDLFGTISEQWDLFAGANYLEGMKAFHETYMPSHEILSLVMEQLQSYEIDMICPQHGSVIQNKIDLHIKTLKELQCGLFLSHLRKNLAQDGGYIKLASRVLWRLVSVFGETEVQGVFAEGVLQYEATNKWLSSEKLTEKEIWEAMFARIGLKKGTKWLRSVSSQVELMCNEYGLKLPKEYSPLIQSAELGLIEKASSVRKLELAKLELEAKVKRLENSLFRDPITGLYNQRFHDAYLQRTAEEIAGGKRSLSYLLISIDNLAIINLDFGSSEGDKTLKSLATLLSKKALKSSQVCRLSGGLFSMSTTLHARGEVLDWAKEFTRQVSEYTHCIIPITISMGLYGSEELPQSSYNDPNYMVQLITQNALFRLRLARKQGGNNLLDTSKTMVDSRSMQTILLVDTPNLARDLVQRELEKERYDVITADDGLQAQNIIETNPPDLIICELLVSKVGGMTLRKQLLESKQTARIPFILMSSNRSEENLLRAFGMGIEHFIPRPIAIYELVGLVTLLFNKQQAKEM